MDFRGGAQHSLASFCEYEFVTFEAGARRFEFLRELAGFAFNDFRVDELTIASKPSQIDGVAMGAFALQQFVDNFWDHAKINAFDLFIPLVAQFQLVFAELGSGRQSLDMLSE